MAGPKGEEETLRLDFLKERFSRYYEDTELPAPLKIEQREFGVITERGGMWRHLAFENIDKMHDFIRKQVPLHAYHSSAYYETPDEKFMDDKKWLGADLVFDLDADHIEGAETLGLEEMLAAVKIEFKITGSFQKEEPFFREEQGESGQVDLLVIGLDLGEIGIYSHIQSEVIGEPVLDIQSQFEIRIVIPDIGRFIVIEIIVLTDSA